MHNKDFNIQFDFDSCSNLYEFSLKLDGKNQLNIMMDSEQFESIANSMIKLIKDVNLLQANDYLKRSSDIGYPLLEHEI